MRKAGIKKVIALFLVVSLMSASAIVINESTVNASGLTVWTGDNLTKIFRATTPPTNATTTINLYAARNEYRAAQIAVRSSANINSLSLVANALSGPQGSTITTSNISAKFIDYIHLTQHTDQLPVNEQVTAPDSSMYYPDRITNDTSLSGGLAANTTQPIWYSVYIPPSAAAGTYTGTVIVQTDAGDVTVNVNLKVYDVMQPNTNTSTYKVDNWFASAGWDDTTWDGLEYQFGITKWSNSWWTVMTNVAKYMKTHRNNTIWIDPIGCLEPDTQIDAQGNYTFNWDKFDALVQKFIDEGAMKYLHGASLYQGRDSNGRFQLKMLKKVNGQVQIAYTTPQSAEANAWLNIYLPALKSHLTQKGWLEIFYQSGGDEPGNFQDRDDDSWLYDKIHSLAPGIKTIEALHVFMDAFTDKLDTFVVKQDVFESNTSYFSNRQSAGDEVWLYICNYPAGSYLGRYIDTHLAKVLLPHYYTYKHGLDGYLHWGWNYWTRRSVLTEADSPSPGDSWLVYPDKDNLDFFGSIRGEVELEGIQDRELLQLLADNNKADLAKNIADALIYSATDYTKNADVITRARITMLENLENTASNDVFVDYCDNFDEIYAMSSNFIIDSSNPNVAGGDTGRIVRSANSEEHIIYQRFNIRSFTAKFYYELSDDVDFYVSSDNHMWTKLAVSTDTPVMTDQGWYSVNKSCSDIPWGSNYLKIVFKNSNTYNWVPQLGQITMTHGYEGPQNVIFKDHLNDFSKIYSKTSNWGLDSAHADAIAEGDGSRACRLVDGNEELVYHMQNMTSFTAKFYSDASKDVEFYVSSDGVNWEKVIHSEDNPVTTDWGWYRVNMFNTALPSNSNYLKIKFLSTNTHHWAPQLGEIQITYTI